MHEKTLAWMSRPLGVVMALDSLNVNVPRYILEHKLGPAELGIFASLAYLVTAMGLIAMALGQSVCARMARLFADGDLSGFRAVLGKLLLFAADSRNGCSGSSPQVAGRTVLTFVYRPEYAEQLICCC